MPIGYKHSEKTKLLLKKQKLGKKLSPEHRAKVIKTLALYRKGENNPNWKGGRVTNYADKKRKTDRVAGVKGYVWLKLPNHPNAYKGGYYPEHRYTMEKHLGRVLGKYEHIHHINGKKDDNRIENLELINAQTHNLISRMETRIKELEVENKMLKVKLGEK